MTDRRTLFWGGALAAIVASMFGYYAYEDRRVHSEGDVRNVTQTIKDEFGKREGTTVSSVKMAHDASGNLTGYAKLHSTAFGGLDITESCIATRVENNEFILKCSPL